MSNPRSFPDYFQVAESLRQIYDKSRQEFRGNERACQHRHDTRGEVLFAKRGRSDGGPGRSAVPGDLVLAESGDRLAAKLLPECFPSFWTTARVASYETVWKARAIGFDPAASQRKEDGNDMDA